MRRGLISSVNISEVPQKSSKYDRLPTAEAIRQAAALEMVEFDELHTLEVTTFCAAGGKEGSICGPKTHEPISRNSATYKTKATLQSH